MSSLTRFRPRQARRPVRSTLRLESLEPRLALAALVGGNVTAQFSGSLLLLTGDKLDYVLLVSSAPGGKMAVLSAPGTTINGSTNPFVTSRTVTNIVANLNGGNDAIGFTNSAQGLSNQLTNAGLPTPFSPVTLQAAIDLVAPGITTFTLPGSLTVTTAAGNDAVILIGNVGGSAAVNLGSALAGAGKNGNLFAIGDPAVFASASRVGGSVSVVGGDQNDGLTIYGTSGGGITAALGNGENEAGVVGAGSTIGSFAYTGGTGRDDVTLVNGLTVRNDVNVFTGTQGEDSFNMYVTVNVGGSVIVNTGTGADYDYIDLGAVIKRNLSLLTGAGNDVLTLNNASAFAAFLYGGTGANTLNSNGPTRTNVRTLRYFQFQTVNNLA